MILPYLCRFFLRLKNYYINHKNNLKILKQTEESFFKEIKSKLFSVKEITPNLT